MVQGEARTARRDLRREKQNVSRALSNRKGGLFHPRSFKNGPLVPGYQKHGPRLKDCPRNLTGHVL